MKLPIAANHPPNRSADCVKGCGVRERYKIRSKKLLTRPASLEMYRKREFAMRVHEHDGVARFRYSDLKGAARFAADAGAMQIQMRED